jgi:predicted ATP-grasp superfamily ATP-dependent carboligase
MLAQAANHEGKRPVVVDCFGDQDTRRYAEALIHIPDLSEAHVIPAINDLKERYPIKFGIYGAGFDQHQVSLHYFCSQLTVLGNQPDIFTKVHDKLAFFTLLKKLDIPFPETTFRAPEHREGWLVKPMQGQGGVGIRRFINHEPNENSVYWQKYQKGIPHSVLFLADGRRSQIVGFNRQWTAALSKTDEFLFSGIINHTELTEKQRRQLTKWINQLVLELSIKGLNSLDFIQNGENSYALEINPRPPASMQLYHGYLLTLHINACCGEMPESFPQQSRITGFQVVYAEEDIQMPDDFCWPEGSQDMPAAGSIISAGQPICSIIIKGKEPTTVFEELQIRQALIVNHLKTGL